MQLEMIHLHSASGRQVVVSAVMFSTASHLRQDLAPLEGEEEENHEQVSR